MAGLLFPETRPGKPLIFSWNTLPGAAGIELWAHAGFQACAIDMQHGMMTVADMLAMINAVHKAGKPVFVRPPWGDTGTLGKALDAGAAAVIVPMIDNPEQAAELVRLAKYPPMGARSWGPALAIAASGLSADDYLAQANDLTKVFAMIETREALDNVREICATPGLDGVFVGPNDLSINLTGGTARDPEHPEVAKAMETVVLAARAAGCLAGAYSPTAAMAKDLKEMGFDFMSISSDASVVSEAAARTFTDAGLS